MNYRKYLPSKRFLTSFAIAIMFVLIAVAFTYKNPTPKGGLVVENSSASTSSLLDQLSPEEQQVAEQYESLNPTDKMARDLMSNIIATQPANGSMDQETIDNLVNGAVGDIPQKNFSTSTDISDLNLIPINPDTFGKDITAYANIYYAQTEKLRKIMGQDLNLINDYINTQSDKDKTDLASIVVSYKDIISNLVQVPIPATADSQGVIDHLKIINDLEILIDIDNDIINAKYDSVDVISDLALYSQTSNDLLDTLGNIDTVLKIQRN